MVLNTVYSGIILQVTPFAGSHLSTRGMEDIVKPELRYIILGKAVDIQRHSFGP